MTLENYNYRTNPMFLRNQFKSKNVFNIPNIPKIELSDEDFNNLKLIAFNAVKSDDGKNSDRFVHFFLYDYNFEKVWQNPDGQIDMLSKYKGILTPDFSMYLEMPDAVKLYNTFRNRWCGAYFASKGIKVIPTVSWGDESTFSFCFKGIPKGSYVAVSTYMFQAHGNHSDQKDVFMKGYDRMIEEIEPEKIICYSQPFEEMRGDIVYIDYELNSWRYLKDSNFSKHYVKRICTYDGSNISNGEKMFYVVKGGGSAYGGGWKPKKENDKRFIGKPNTTRDNHVNTKEGGYKVSDSYDENGLATQERHYTDHNRGDLHTNPHDHNIDWSHGYPDFSPPINYPDGNIPEFKQYISMYKENTDNMYNADDFRFKTLGEFKIYLTFCSELSFEYNNVEYGIDKMQDGKFYISNCNKKACIQGGLTLEEVLNYEIDGVKIRDFIATKYVEITDRPGPM